MNTHLTSTDLSRTVRPRGFLSAVGSCPFSLQFASSVTFSNREPTVSRGGMCLLSMYSAPSQAPNEHARNERHNRQSAEGGLAQVGIRIPSDQVVDDAPSSNSIARGPLTDPSSPDAIAPSAGDTPRQIFSSIRRSGGMIGENFRFVPAPAGLCYTHWHISDRRSRTFAHPQRPRGK